MYIILIGDPHNGFDFVVNKDNQVFATVEEAIAAGEEANLLNQGVWGISPVVSINDISVEEADKEQEQFNSRMFRIVQLGISAVKAELKDMTEDGVFDTWPDGPPTVDELDDVVEALFEGITKGEEGDDAEPD
jgi:hypothetical protein